MKPIFLFLLLFAIMGAGFRFSGNGWLIEKHKKYTLYYTASDKKNKKEYTRFIEKGFLSVQAFFDTAFKTGFSIYIHPNRQSLNTQWQKDWKMPDFKSECWMVASGVARQLDIISPNHWDTEACEHLASDKKATQQVITHELVHVFHGQKNVSPDFNTVTGMDWFIEGLATYASGQYDSLKQNAVRKAVEENKVPAKLEQFWTGNLRYAISGSIVMYIDRKYGRAPLKQLLSFGTLNEILAFLNTTESDLITGWKNFTRNHNK